MSNRFAAAGVVICLALVGCGGGDAHTTVKDAASPVASTTTGQAETAPPIVGPASSVASVPATSTTPPASGPPGPDYSPPGGATNPDVSQATIASTICISGWTATVRPPVSYTNALKVVQMTQRHLPGTPADYEEDHI